MTSGEKPETLDPILIQRDRSPGVVELTLNSPKQYNALSEEMLFAFQQALDSISARSDVKVLVISANGKAFCAGHDLKQMRAHPQEAYYEDLFSRCSTMMVTLAKMPQISIAKVQGMATAAGCQLVANVDLAVACNDARFAVSGINLGLFCSTPSVPLSRNVARKRAFEMLTTGEFIDAETAVAAGLINSACPASVLDETVKDLCNTIASIISCLLLLFWFGFGFRHVKKPQILTGAKGPERQTNIKLLEQLCLQVHMCFYSLVIYPACQP